MTSKGKKVDLLEQLFKMRDEQREMVKKGTKVVKGQQLPVETNRMGLYRWYLHPLLDDRATKAIMLWTQEIPPGSHSGKQKHQGGRVHYVLEGKGYTVVDGVKHDWEKGDVILLPIKPNGVVFQHFNSDTKNKARLVAAEPNWTDALGVDLGASFEQVENAPEFKG
ncbi:MAG: cupin domain-containing protein [Dehalococcoidia bacterium]|nr:cupin domain-containing protein [Dehalococcoidia bacterium]